MKTKDTRPRKVNVITLGCSKNLVDSENLITQLRHNRYDVSHDADQTAEIVIINTCGFIDAAKEESIDTILEYARQKEEGGLEKLYVTGCLSQRYRAELQQEIPEVDAWYGTMELPSLLHILNADYRQDLIGERIITTPAHYAYLKISEGCNRTCAFCAIPLMRGKHVSRPIGALVKEAEHLASQGVKELMLIAQELTYYGLDLYKRRALADLLDALADVDGIHWIRLHYAYPQRFPLEVIDVMARRPEICNYLDMPLQHADDAVLQRMRRQITQAETRELVSVIRSAIPEITLRTTFIAGFPGETDEQFEVLCDFVRELQFDRVGVFQYSHEEQTHAFAEADDVPPDVKAYRAERLMDIQREISRRKNESKVGSIRKVLIDRRENGYYTGRTEGDSPEVDNEILVTVQGREVLPGAFCDVRITGADDYDLYGEIERHD